MVAHLFSKAAVVVPLASVFVLFTLTANGVTHIVGDSIWSIPPTNDFYQKWSSSRAFHPGDILYFEFESGMYQVMRVNNWEHDICEANVAIPLGKVYTEGPAWVPLDTEDYYYYVSHILNHCSLGVKLSVFVNRTTPLPVPDPHP
ncbi:hypothetical protein R6Q57_026995 [Mikania cordata]